MPLEPFDGALLKFERAKHHINDLNRQVAEFFKQKACSFVFIRDIKAREAAIRFEQHKPPPDVFGLIIGDAIHNLRSALDFAVCDIACAHGADPERVQFPFAKRPDGLEQVIISRQVQLAGPKVVQAIRDLKPYPGGNDDLFGLHMLDIADKHRLLITTVSAAMLENLTVPNLDTSTPAFQMMRRAAFIGLKHEEEIVRIPYAPPSRAIRRATRAFKEKTDIGGSFHIAFAEGLPFEHEPVVPILVRLNECVASALHALGMALT